MKEEKLLGEGHGREEMAHIGVRPSSVEEDSKGSMQEEGCGYESMLNVVEMSG